MHVLYILKSKSDERLYIGVTSDLKRRLAEHQSGKSRYTKSRGPWVLVYGEAYCSKLDALERERKLKQFKNSYKSLKARIRRSLEDA